MTSLPWHRDPLAAALRRDPQDPRLPGGVVGAGAFVALLVLVGIPGVLGTAPTAGLVTALAIVATAGWWTTPGPAAAVAAVAFLTVDGFVENAGGDLGWEGVPDLLRLGLLLAASVGASWLHARGLDEQRLDAARRALAAERAHRG